MKAQFLYDLREATAFCSGEELHEFFDRELGDPSPKGAAEVADYAAATFVADMANVSYGAQVADYLCGLIVTEDVEPLVTLLNSAAGITQRRAEHAQMMLMAEYLHRGGVRQCGRAHSSAGGAEAARLDDLSRRIYGIVSGADNTDEIDATQSDIHDWLADGDLDGDETAEQLAAEYIEYCETAMEATE